MDHAYAEEHGLVSLYRSGRLAPDEEQRFEEHYFACTVCQEELDHQRRFEQGLQAMRAEKAVPVPAESRPAAEGKLLRFPRRPTVWLALAASLLLAAALPWALLWRGRAEASAREAAAWRLRAEQGEAEKKALAVRLAQSERLARENDGKARQLEGRLAERQLPPSARDSLARPTAGTSLLLLTHLRGNEPGAASNRLDLRDATGIVHLALDPGNATGFSSYRATLTDAAGKPLYTADSLHPNALEVILLTFPRDFFAAGEYRLRLEGRRADETFEAIETYRFRVER